MIKLSHTHYTTMLSCLLVLLLVNSSSGLDNQYVGIKEGDIYTYQLDDYSNTNADDPKMPIYCGNDQPLPVEIGNLWTMEIANIRNHLTDVSLIYETEQKDCTYSMIDRTSGTFILSTDWQHWEEKVTKDWSWADESNADHMTLSEDENITSFTSNLVIDVGDTEFHTLLDYTMGFVASFEIRSFSYYQHIKYDISAGVITVWEINQTMSFWNNTYNAYYEKISLVNSERGGQSTLESSIILTILAVTVIIYMRQKTHQTKYV